MAIFLFAVAASAQTPGQNAPPKLEPYQAKALENALGRPDTTIPKGFSGPFTAAPLSLILAPPAAPPDLIVALPAAAVEFAKACVIPLLAAPMDPEVDRGIRRELKPDALGADHMPVFKGLPICGTDH